jgi:hypothetical protein
MRNVGTQPSRAPIRAWVEPWPAGGYAVRLAGHDRPVSRHDTEEEARARAEGYEHALLRDVLRGDASAGAARGVGDQPGSDP